MENEQIKRVTLLNNDSVSSNNINNTNSNYSINLFGFSSEQLLAFEKYKNGENIFITGPGGSGKTHLIKTFHEYNLLTNKHIPICAMTGCAAVLLNCNARTLHSWSGIKLAKGDKKTVVMSVLRNKYAMKQWRKAKGIILDEVSMLSKKVLEIIEEIARSAKQSSLPFGGMQVIFTGDFFQLPPVGTPGEQDTELFCFESPIWKSIFKPENHIELKTIFRQNDPIYVNMLNEIRVGELSDKNKEILKGYVKREYETEKLNGCIPTKLFALRAKTDFVNSQMFSKIKEKEYVFEAIRKSNCVSFIDSTKPIPVDAIDKCKELSETDRERELDILIGSMPCPQVLRLKKGSAVMCNINLDMDNGICNGSQGIVEDIFETSQPPLIKVRFSTGITKIIGIHYWQSDDYPTLAIGQYPLCLAWALTIHKIQGATLSIAEMDIGQSIFEYGQTYVALSRIKSLEGLYLSDFIPDRIRANPKVVDFYKTIHKYSEMVAHSNQERKCAELIEETYDSESIPKKQENEIKNIRLI
jgi:ATP-dependent DNA helicase PIF1